MIIIKPIPKHEKTWTIYEISQKATPQTWEELFTLARNELFAVSKTINDSCPIYYPLKHEIFNCFHLTSLHDVKVVIIGQDPCPQMIEDLNIPRAHGLSFSQRKDEKIIPSHLKNIYKEIKSSYPEFVAPDNGDLTSWARQGVFLINSCLTYDPNASRSDHKNREIWNSFISKTLSYINRNNPHIAFVLWGTDARTVFNKSGIKNAKMFTSTHPSGLSAGKGTPSNQAFIGSRHFLLVNEYLEQIGVNPIDWSL